MQPTIKTITNKKLIGKSLGMSMVDNKTYELFRSFMPRRKEIQYANMVEVYDLRVYPEDYHVNFNPANNFTKWALVEVSEIENVPDQMEVFNLKGGSYAVFDHKGPQTDTSIFQYIFTSWFPNSEYDVDHRPHFELLRVGTKPNDPNAQQQIWVPVIPKIQ